MVNQFLFIGLPYLAIAVCVAGCLWRWKTNRFSFSSLSSQFLEDRALLWGSAAWHTGIILVLLGHLAVFVAPGIWQALMSQHTVLLATETAGFGLGLLSLLGLGVLLVRRLTCARVQAVTTIPDILVGALLMVQVSAGLLTAALHPWGAAWAPGIAAPYVRGLLTLRPDTAWVADFPPIFKVHLTGACLILLLAPFSRLVHVLVLPIAYLWRAPIVVLWTNPRRRRHAVQAVAAAETRREFVRGAVGIAAASAFLSVGVAEKLFLYFRNPPKDVGTEADLLEKKLHRLQQTAETRSLELERMRNEYILVARYPELDRQKGRYFIGFDMAPALAFLGDDGLPLLISAKCTHLGCTVGSEMNEKGQILCPCHVSYFNVRSGRPNEGAPAKAPLPHLPWVLRDATGKVVASRFSDGRTRGEVKGVELGGCSLFVAKRIEES